VSMVESGDEDRRDEKERTGLGSCRGVSQWVAGRRPKVAIVWFRKGSLRVDDNPALSAAVTSGVQYVMPVFVHGASSHQYGDDTHYALGCIEDLKKSIRARGSHLEVLRRDREVDAIRETVNGVSSMGFEVAVFVLASTDLVPSSQQLRSLGIRVFVCLQTPVTCEPHSPVHAIQPHPFHLSVAPFHVHVDISGETSARRRLRRVALGLKRRPQLNFAHNLELLFARELRWGSLSRARISWETRIGNLSYKPDLSHTYLFASSGLLAGWVSLFEVSHSERRLLEWDEERQKFKLRDRDWMYNADFELRDWVRRQKNFLKGVFFPEDVTPDYYAFTAWRFFQRCVTSTVGVFGTQALLLAVGIKAGRIGQAATISWVLKDGLGRLGKMVWAGGQGKFFDVDPKRWRFNSALIYACGNGLEIMTQIFPSFFLVVATVANAMKQISMLTASATRNTMYKSFGGRRDNIGNITAKGEAQIVVADLIGMFCGIQLSKVLAGNRKHLIMAYAILSLVDIVAIYQELRQVVFRSLNPERATLVIHDFIENGKVPTPQEITRREGILLPPRFLRRDTFSTPRRVLLTPEELEHSLRIFKHEKYLIGCPSRSRRCNIVVREGARSVDVLQSLLTLGYLHVKGDALEDRSSPETALENAKRNWKPFMESLHLNGWNVDNLVFHAVQRRASW